MILVAGGSASALAVVGGIVFAVVSSAHAADAREHREMLVAQGGPRPCLKSELAEGCAEIHSALEARDRFGNAAAWSFITGGVLGAGTVIYGLAASKSRVKATPSVGLGSAGLVVSGVW